MTLNEQIMKLQTYKMFEGEDTVYVERDDVLKLLEQEPCEDAISRKAVLDKLNRLIEVERLQGSDEMGYGRERVSAYECMIYEVESEYLYPTIQPQPKTGHWIKTKEQNDAEPLILWKCSECLAVQRLKTKYCPNCGCTMKGE